MKKNWPTFSYGFLWENVHLGYGYFLHLDLVGSDFRYVTKSESTGYPVIITILPTSCYLTSRKKLYLLLLFLNIAKKAAQGIFEILSFTYSPPCVFVHKIKHWVKSWQPNIRLWRFMAIFSLRSVIKVKRNLCNQIFGCGDWGLYSQPLVLNIERNLRNRIFGCEDSWQYFHFLLC